MDIHARRLRFRIAQSLPKYWNHGNPVKTHLFNAISVLAPAFERLAISSVLPFKDKSHQNSRLQAQVCGFIEQESAHGAEFIRFNTILKKQGYQVKALERENLKKFRKLAKKFSKKNQLSFTLAAEHLTAIISDELLRHDHWLENADPQVRALWRWHAIEEIEHKAVAFDLYQHMGGGYGARVLGMLVVTITLGMILTKNFFYFIRQDKLLFKLNFWWHYFAVLWIKPGLIRRLLVPYLQYFLPNFHPWHKDNRILINAYKKHFSKAQDNEAIVEILGMNVDLKGNKS